MSLYGSQPPAGYTNSPNFSTIRDTSNINIPQPPHAQETHFPVMFGDRHTHHIDPLKRASLYHHNNDVSLQRAALSTHANGDYPLPIAHPQRELIHNASSFLQRPLGFVGNSPVQSPATRSPLPAGFCGNRLVDASNVSIPTNPKTLSGALMEEGELEDGEVSESEVNGDLNKAANSDQTPSKQIANENTPRSKPLSGLTEGPQRSSTNVTDNLPKHETTGITMQNTLMQSNRDQILRILRELKSFQITLQEIATEGIDSEVLRRYYHDADIEVPSGCSPSQEDESPLTFNVSAKTRLGAAGDSPQTQSSEDPGITSRSPRKDMNKDAQSSDGISASNVQSGSVLSVGDDDSSVRPRPLAIDTNSPQPTSIIKAVRKDTQTKTVERKEYIARMLAAKNKKAILTSDVDVLLPIDPTSMVPNAKQAISPQNAKSSLNAKPCQPRSSATISDTPQIHKNAPDPEAKKKAQTELARRKIEALAAQKKSKQNPSGGTSAEVPISNPPPAEPISTIVPVTAKPSGDCDGKMSSVSAVSTPPRHKSYFSPISQTAAFSIPGLFMASKISDSERPPSIQMTDGALPHPQKLHDISNGTGMNDIRLITDRSEGKVDLPAARIPTLVATQDIPKGSIDTSFRKRQKAADFIDSPATRIKKPLGCVANASVIIDISEEESEVSDDFDLLAGNEKQKGPPIEFTPSVAMDNGKIKSGKELKSINESSTEAPPAEDSACMTPSASCTPSKSHEPKELKSKELEIELMNRKIAELEERIKSKQSASRAQSPGLPVQPVSLQTVSEPTSIHEISQRASSNPETGDTSPVRREKSGSSAVNLNHYLESATEEQLVAEKARQEHVLAATEAEVGQSTKLDTATFTHTIEVDENSKVSEEGQKIETTGNSEGQQNLIMQRHRARRSEIESGLPLLDAEITKTQDKMQSLRLQIAGLEAEYQKGMEGRDALCGELLRLSQSTEVLESKEPPATIDRREKAVEQWITSNGPRVSLQTSANTRLDDFAKGGLQRTSKSKRISRRPSSPGEAIGEISALTHTSLQAHHEASDGEIDDGLQDPGPEGHDVGLVEESQTHAQDNGDCQADDDEDVYEPRVSVSPSQETTETPAISLGQGNGRDALTDCNTATNPTVNHDSTIPPGTVWDNVSDNLETLSKLTQAKASHRGASGSEDGEYEPPEPQSISPNDARPTTCAPANKGSHELGPSDKIEAQDNHAEGGEKRLDLRNGLFTPYESPLKHFKIYRYHPDFPSKFQRGYRSLTYFNDINPEIPLCLYEIDGLCIDETCSYQHFANMELRDDAILFQLGKLPDGVVEKPQYATNLNQLVRDLCNREVKDFETVASEVSRYRSKALRDDVDMEALSHLPADKSAFDASFR